MEEYDGSIAIYKSMVKNYGLLVNELVFQSIL